MRAVEAGVEHDRVARLDRAEAVDDARDDELEGHRRARDAEPGSDARTVDHEGDEDQVDAGREERVEQPLERLPRAAAVAGPQIGRREGDEQVDAPRGVADRSGTPDRPRASPRSPPQDTRRPRRPGQSAARAERLQPHPGVAAHKSRGTIVSSDMTENPNPEERLEPLPRSSGSTTSQPRPTASRCGCCSRSSTFPTSASRPTSSPATPRPTSTSPGTRPGGRRCSRSTAARSPSRARSCSTSPRARRSFPPTRSSARTCTRGCSSSRTCSSRTSARRASGG